MRPPLPFFCVSPLLVVQDGKVPLSPKGKSERRPFPCAMSDPLRDSALQLSFFMLMYPYLRFPGPSTPKFLCYDLRRHAPSPHTAFPQLLLRTLCPSPVSNDGADVFL